MSPAVIPRGMLSAQAALSRHSMGKPHSRCSHAFSMIPVPTPAQRPVLYAKSRQFGGETGATERGRLLRLLAGSGNPTAAAPFLAPLSRCVVHYAPHGTTPGRARPRYTAQLTFRLVPSLRDDLEREAHAKGDALGELVRDILADHTARRSAERARQESRR